MIAHHYMKQRVFNGNRYRHRRERRHWQHGRMSRCFLTVFLAVGLTPVRGQGSVYTLLKDVTEFSDYDFDVLRETILEHGLPRVDMIRTTNPEVARKIEDFNARYDTLLYSGKRFIDQLFAYAVRERIRGESRSTTWNG
ncbi:hypothetical protein ANCCAN_10128 [Ancylostoma caninum]|uniref:Uncharacterized protein n=1 Tax=Ancylostoma caninum TaxID=29170 RepID=A0A368GHK5_ANCCA|nr:hypothetical protein ANCCAN_10128 [Ancylostoma caninum]